MAKRQSLKELQERLAQRLTAAKTEGSTATWLAVEVGGDRFLLPLVQSGEIFPWTSVQAVPYTKPFTKDQLLQAVQQFGVHLTGAA